MGREIRFRAYDKQTKQMSPGFTLFGEFLLIGAVHAWQYECGNTSGSSLEALGDLEVMQYTGLKDKNGKEIYEADILEMDGQFTYEVRFEEGKFVAYHLNTHSVKGTKWGDLHRFFDHDFAEYHVCVIGNIYENQQEK